MNYNRIYWYMKIARDDSAVILTALTYVVFHSTPRKGYQSKFLVVLSKSDRSNFWGLLDCDDWRSRWWASSVRPRHETVMIRMSFNSCDSLAMFFNIIVLFCYVFFNTKLYALTSVSFVWFFNRMITELHSVLLRYWYGVMVMVKR